MKRIICTNIVKEIDETTGDLAERECGYVFSHLLGDKTIDIRRKRQEFLIVGESYSLIGTCAKCDQRVSLIVDNGKLDEEGIKFRDEEDLPDTAGDDTKDPQTAQEDGDIADSSQGSQDDQTPGSQTPTVETPQTPEVTTTPTDAGVTPPVKHTIKRA